MNVVGASKLLTKVAIALLMAGHGELIPRVAGVIDFPVYLIDDHVGGNQWYKNRAGVVRLFMQFAALPPFQSHQLIMAGKPWPDELRALVQGSALAARIHEWTELANEDLRALYSTAEALLFPSLQEGFGWPIAEAQACGCVVVTSNRAPMTEVGGDAAIYIDPDDAPRAAAVIAGTLADRDALVEAGLRNAERFSGAQMVEGYVAA